MTIGDLDGNKALRMSKLLNIHHYDNILFKLSNVCCILFLKTQVSRYDGITSGVKYLSTSGKVRMS